MNEYAFLPFFAFLTNTFLLFYGISRGVRTELQKTYIFFMSSLSFWAFFDFINWNWTLLDHDWVMFIYHIQAPFYLLTGFLFCRFVYSLLEKEKGFLTSQFLIIPVIFSILSLFTSYITKDYKEVWWGVEHSPGILFVPAVVLCVFVPCQYALILIHKSLKTTQNNSQRKHSCYDFRY